MEVFTLTLVYVLCNHYRLVFTTVSAFYRTSMHALTSSWYHDLYWTPFNSLTSLIVARYNIICRDWVELFQLTSALCSSDKRLGCEQMTTMAFGFTDCRPKNSVNADPLSPHQLIVNFFSLTLLLPRCRRMHSQPPQSNPSAIVKWTRKKLSSHWISYCTECRLA